MALIPFLSLFPFPRSVLLPTGGRGKGNQLEEELLSHCGFSTVAR
jgi:hypothetical protein